MTGSSNSFVAGAGWRDSQKDTETSVNKGDTEPDTSNDSDKDIVSSWAVAFGSSVQVQEGQAQTSQIGDCHFDKGCDTSVSTRPLYKPFGQRRATRPNSINFRKSIRGRQDSNVRTHDADGDVIMRDAS
ncbi:hypothetical protein ASPFODRAFT_135934 [Aspergillus luchuensis CBS 106.47]|uniref:Uncharacterized protein n=1 Tax=Aspergillus luchuensis (strain CBS 106.47) TaxID=1137211 RepID=A0A1M3TFV6_ASPLC|nr:hypothetical protein ASPFODRAFT_135934 [Aspergillus luchuensis CBS 106.47]